jgi:homocysteine S-methyltransferase
MSNAACSQRVSFRERLANPRPLLLDGGLATQIEAMGHSLHPTLWSAGLLLTAPEVIRSAHRAYVDAGADVIASASYQASREGFAAIGCSIPEADELLRRSIDLAREAATDAGRPEVLVAASMGPWGAIRHDGSEYTGIYDVGPAELEAFHGERLAILDDSGADALAFETLPHLGEARCLAALLRDARTPAWVSFCCRDESHLSDGTPLAEAAALFRDHPGVVALGINCTPPRFVPALVGKLLDAAPGCPVLVYPNSGEQYDADRQRWRGSLDPFDAGEAARSWLAAGARGVGGCCRMGPEHLRAMGRAIDEEIST